MKKIFVCSPLRGNIEENMKKAEEYCRSIIEIGGVPFAPHLFFTRFLDDEKQKEREAGIRGGMEFLRCCDELWIFGDTITDGMKREIEFCLEVNIPVRCSFSGFRLKGESKIQGGMAING